MAGCGSQTCNLWIATAMPNMLHHMSNWELMQFPQSHHTTDKLMSRMRWTNRHFYSNKKLCIFLYWHKGNKAPSISRTVVDKEGMIRIKLGHWFSALKLLAGWQEWHPVTKNNRYHLLPKVLFQNKWRRKTNGEPAKLGLREMRAIKMWKHVQLEHDWPTVAMSAYCALSRNISTAICCAEQSRDSFL